MDNIIWVSTGIFLLIPYYLRIFILDSQKTKLHIIFWLSVHMIMSLVYYILYKQSVSTAFVLLIGCGIYYLVTYIFQVRNVETSINRSSVVLIVQSKYFRILQCTIYAVGSVMLLVDGVLIFRGSQDFRMLDKLYLMGIIVIAFVQCLIYLKEYVDMLGQTEQVTK